MKPQKTIVTLPTALKWAVGNGFFYEEKLDGQFWIEQFQSRLGKIVLAGELMPGGHFRPFDILERDGQDIKPYPLRDRLAIIDEIEPELIRAGMSRPASGDPQKLIEHVFSKGGEGVVAKDLDSPFGHMFAVKRRIEIVCVITGFIPGKNSVMISDSTTGQDRGRVSIAFSRREKIKVGSLIKVNGFSLTEKGFIREPRLDSDSPDSWLVKI